MITIKNDNDIDMKNQIHAKLRKNNIEKCEWMKNNISENLNVENKTNANFLAFDNGKLIGGAIGFIEYNWYFLDLLYIDKEYRGKKIGTSLIKEIEDFSKKKNLTGVRVETWNFQAKEFYEKKGYNVFGQIEDCPPGTIDYLLRKVF